MSQNETGSCLSFWPLHGVCVTRMWWCAVCRKKGMIIITVLMFVAAILGGLPLTTKAPELLMLSRVFVGLHSGQSRDTQYTARCLYYVCVGYCVYVNHLLCCHVCGCLVSVLVTMLLMCRRVWGSSICVGHLAVCLCVAMCEFCVCWSPCCWCVTVCEGLPSVLVTVLCVYTIYMCYHVCESCFFVGHHVACLCVIICVRVVSLLVTMLPVSVLPCVWELCICWLLCCLCECLCLSDLTQTDPHVCFFESFSPPVWLC